MPIFEHKPVTRPAAVPKFTPEPMPSAGPTFADSFMAGFKLENDVLAAWDFLTEPEFEIDPEFDVLGKTKNSPYWETDYRENFARAQSEAEWEAIAGKINRELKLKETAGASGWGGMFGAIAGGAASPTMLIPALTPIRGIRGVAAAAGLGVGAAGIAEIPLQLQQETRSTLESATALAAGGVIGGALGAGANALKSWQANRLIKEFEREVYEAMPDAAVSSGMAGPPSIPYGSELRVIPPLQAGDWEVSLRTDTMLTKPAALSSAPDNILAQVAARADLENFIDEVDPTLRQSRQELKESIERIKASTVGPVKDEIVEQIARLESRIASASGKQKSRLQNELEELQATPVVNTEKSPELRALEKELAKVDASMLKRFDAFSKQWKELESTKSLLLDEGINADKFIRGVRDELTSDPEQALRRKLYEEAPPIRITQEGPNIVPPPTVPASGAGSAGAQSLIKPDAGAFKNQRAVVLSGATLISPVAQTIAQGTHLVARRVMSKLGVAGLRFERNAEGVAASPGGTVEARVKIHNAKVYKATLALDELYQRYLYNAKPVAFGNVRARVASTFKATSGKMSREDFNTEVSRALFEQDSHPIAEIATAAKIIRAEVFNPMLKEAKAVELFNEQFFDDESYLTRIYDTRKMAQNPTAIINKFSAHYKKLIETQLDRSKSRWQQAKEVKNALIDDLEADEATARERQAQLKNDLELMGESDEEIQISALRGEARQIRKQAKDTSTPIGPESAKRLDEIKAEVSALRETIAPRLKQKRMLKRRLRNLDRTNWALEEKRQKQFESLDRIEDQSLNSLRSVLAKGKQLERDLNKISNRNLAKQLKLIGTQTETLIERLSRAEKRLDNAKTDEAAERAKATLVRTREKLEVLDARRLELSDSLNNRDTIASWLEQYALTAGESVNRINLTRGERRQRIKDKIEKLSPKNVQREIGERLAEVKGRFAKLEDRIDTRMRELGIEDWSHAGSSEMLDEVVAERAKATYSRIMSYSGRVGGIDLQMEERGAELARVLTIPSMEIFDFLVTDAERVVRDYVRQVGADIELKRAFGDVELKTMRDEMNEEHIALKLRMEEDGASQKQLQAMEDRHRQNLTNIMTAVARIRHNYGIPDNPDSFMARGGKMLLDLNNLRFMGSVAVSSLSDPKQIVLKNGLARSLKTALIPFIHGLKGIKATREEFRSFGGGLDPILHSRATAIADTIDQYVGNSTVEKGIHTMSSKFGNFALFNYWTQAMKDMDYIASSARVWDNLDTVINGKGNAKKQARAREDLAYMQIDSDFAQRIHAELQEHGSLISGVRYANLEDWTDQEAASAYKAAFIQSSTDTIIEPGLELPNMVNASVAARLIFQFKSFGLASHSKTLAASLQTPDAAVANSIISGIGLGMMGYYIHSNLVGGEAQKQMESAPLEKWLDEGISRSGVLGALDIMQRFAERIPAVDQYATFSGERTTRRGGTDLMGELLGPSFDAANRMFSVLTAIDDPTQSTISTARALMPYQNVFYLRRLFKLLEENIQENFPERRTN